MWKEFSPSPATITEIVHIGQAIMAQRGAANTIQILCQYDVQLSDHGRSLSGGGVERFESAGLNEDFPWISLRISN
jgi:hypothetical protein